MVNILAVSDETTLRRGGSAIESTIKDNVDIIINCGDLPPEYMDYLVMHYRPAFNLMVHGNHDKSFYHIKGQEAKAPNVGFSKLYSADVINQGIYKARPGRNNELINTLAIGGFSGSMTEGMNRERRWPFYFREKDAKKFVNNLKRERRWNQLLGKEYGIDIMASHAAPDIGLLKGTPNTDILNTIGSHHRPSKALGELYKEFNPALWLYGHIHSNYTTKNLDFTWKDSYMLNVVPFKLIVFDEKEKRVHDYYPK
ncbi:metallophosphoesterase [Candidatus Woesearchaeota archaeon]|nr:metallophosphoesterase [Candidatus Woesearchaeota archaeon]